MLIQLFFLQKPLFNKMTDISSDTVNLTVTINVK